MVVSKESLDSRLHGCLGELLEPQQLELCLQELQIIEPRPGQFCWDALANKPGIYLIVEGKARLLDGEDNLLLSLDRGWFGQMSLFPDGEFAPYRVRASAGLKLGCLSFASWQKLTAQNHRLEGVMHRQAIELDLLLRHRQADPKSAYDLLPLLSEMKSHQIPRGELPQAVWQDKLWLIRSGELLHTSGKRLLPGIVYLVKDLPQGEWLITQPTELYTFHRQPLLRHGNAPSLKQDRPKPSSSGLVLNRDGAIATTPEIVELPEETVKPFFPKPQTKITHWWQQQTKRYPFYKQHSASDCGVACLVMIGKYWGKSFGINQLRNLANVDRAGTSIRGIISAADYLGFIVRPRKADLTALEQQELPAIAHWEGNHYIVVYRVTKNRVIVSDPRIGRRILTRQEFVANWTGYTVFLTPTAKFEQAPEAKQNLWKYASILQPYWLVLLEVFVTSLMIQVVGLFSPIFTQVLLDRVVVQRSVSTLIAVGIGLIVFRLFRIALSNLRRYLLYHTANKLDLSLIVGFIAHALRLPLSYFETRYVGDITSRIRENRKIRRFITGDAITTVLDVLSVFVYLFLMVWYSWQMSLLALAIIPVFAVTTFVSTPFLLRISRERFNADTVERSYLIEALTGIGTIKSMGVERSVRWRWEDLISEAVRINFNGKMIRQRIDIITSVLETLISSTLLLFGVWQVIQNQLTIGQLIAFNMLVGNVISPFKRLISLWNDFQEIRIAIERTDDVLKAVPEQDSARAGLAALPPVKGQIRFDSVTFRYNLESENNTLENLSFEVEPGQTIALVGRSGSGKTTIAKLLLGLYSPTKGKISIDGYDVSNIDLHSLRKQAGVVDQNTFLFGGTILANLTIGHPNASQSQVKEACRLAGAAEFIEEMPLKYNTQIGEGGGLLSGGQRQRLAIARALLGKPRLLILDEATSNLDAESERIIQQNLESILNRQTTLIIAHRLSTVRKADLILVMDRGLLVESGTHQELMAKQGQYYYLNQQQLAVNN